MDEWNFTIFVLCFVPLVVVDTTFGDRNSSECTLKCIEGDGSATCWTGILDYFTDDLQTALQDYVTAVAHLSRWQHRHGEDNTTTKDFIAESLQWKLRDDGPLNRDDLINVFRTLLNMSSVDKLLQPEAAEHLPLLSCPTPCNYYPKMWASLFFITFTAFSLCCLAFVIHLCHNERLRGAVKRDGILYQPT